MTHASAVAAAVAALAAARPPVPPDASTIIKRSITADASDWGAEPRYDHCERDTDGDSSKTYDITMIEGTPYERLVAVADRPLSPTAQREEDRRRARELARRRAESPAQRTERIRRYRRKHARLAAMFHQLDSAFTFRMTGEDEVDGRTAYMLTGQPRPDYRPPTREARALNGMTVDFWIDTRAFHWVKLIARVTHPVSIVGFVARVEPGTTIELEKAPVDNAVWLTTHLRITASSRILYLFGHHTMHDERSFDFRRASDQRQSQCLM